MAGGLTREFNSKVQLPRLAAWGRFFGTIVHKRVACEKLRTTDLRVAGLSPGLVENRSSLFGERQCGGCPASTNSCEERRNRDW